VQMLLVGCRPTAVPLVHVADALGCDTEAEAAAFCREQVRGLIPVQGGLGVYCP